MQSIVFECSEADAEEWDFLLFQPSQQHTAALCLQRSAAGQPVLGSSGSSNGAASERKHCQEVESSCDYGDTADNLKSPEASSSAANGSVMADSQANGSLSTKSSMSEGWQPANRSKAGSNQTQKSSASSALSGAGVENSIDSGIGLQTRGLASRLVAWRVVPLVSESMIRTQDLEVLGMTGG